MSASVQPRNEPIGSLVQRMQKAGLSLPEIYVVRDALIRSDKNLTNLGSIVVGTPVPNAIDANGNLLLKNINQGQAVTAGPTTNSASFTVIPEMTQTIAFKGNKAIIIFNGTFQVDTLASLLTLQIFRDGVGVGYQSLVSAPGVSYFFPQPITWEETPSAGTHTYDVRWKVSAGTATATGTNRALQITELG